MYRRLTRQGRSLVTMHLSDATGTLQLVFFNQGWITRKYSVGDTVIAFGKMRLYRGKLQMNSPVIDPWGDQTDRLVAVYPQSGGQRRRAHLGHSPIHQAHPQTLQTPRDRRSGTRGCATQPGPDRPRAGLSTGYTGQIQRGSTREPAKGSCSTSCSVCNSNWYAASGDSERQRPVSPHATDGDLVKRFHQSLPFPLTGAQIRVTSEISADLAKPWPMNRLLQGDVGSARPW